MAAVASSQPTPRTVSPAVRNNALAAGAGWWLRDLPDLVAELEREWSITVGRSYEDTTEAFVAEATLADGTPALLKLLIARPGDHARNETTVLRLADGKGCARLLRDDVARGALLQERLGRSLHQLTLPIARRHEILCSAAARVWRPAAGCALPTGADKGRKLADFIPAARESSAARCSPPPNTWPANPPGATRSIGAAQLATRPLTPRGWTCQPSRAGVGILGGAPRMPRAVRSSRDGSRPPMAGRPTAPSTAR